MLILQSRMAMGFPKHIEIVDEEEEEGCWSILYYSFMRKNDYEKNKGYFLF